MSEKGIVRAALESYSSDFPDSVIGDLMMLFPDDIVLKILTCFSGEAVSFPKVDKIWKSYRDSVIHETLGVRNTQQQQRQLSEYFGIPVSRVLEIFRREETKRGTRSKDSVERAARVACRSISRK